MASAWGTTGLLDHAVLQRPREKWPAAQAIQLGLHMQGNPNMLMALAGNKADLADSRAVTKEEAAAYAEENGLAFWETSAKTNVSVLEVSHSLASSTV